MKQTDFSEFAASAQAGQEGSELSSGLGVNDCGPTSDRPVPTPDAERDFLELAGVGADEMEIVDFERGSQRQRDRRIFEECEDPDVIAADLAAIHAEEEPEAIAVAFDCRNQRVYVIEGDDETEYPVTFEEVQGDGELVIKSDVDRIHKKVLGFRFMGEPYDSDGGRELREMVEEVRHSDDQPVEILERRLESLPESLQDSEECGGGTQKNPAESANVATDGGSVVEVADPDDPEPNREVRIIEKPAVGLMSPPRIVTGAVSSSAKSIIIPDDEGFSDKCRYLDTAEIFAGESEYRDSTSYELYTPGRFISQQRANYGPGPQSGANEISDPDDLPAPTHWPASVEEIDELPDECPECEHEARYTQQGPGGRCQWCGKHVEPGDEEESEQEQEQEIQENPGDVAADGGSAANAASDDGPEPKHFGDYRRDQLERLEETPHLEPVESFDSIDEMVGAIEEMHISGYSKPPEKTIQRLRAIFDDLPDDEARRHYLNDYKLGRTLNSARRHFNKWVGRKKRYDQMPGWAEAGPANYPKRKHKKRRDSERKGREKLEEKLDRLHGRVKGAQQRALQKAGTSVAEQNQKKADNLMEQRRAEWEPGGIVVYRSPNLHAGAIVRLNKKSVRVQRPNNLKNADFGPDGEFRRETIDLDSDHITRYEPDDLHKIQNLDRGQTVPDTLEAAQREMLGDEWVEEHSG